MEMRWNIWRTMSDMTFCHYLPSRTRDRFWWMKSSICSVFIWWRSIRAYVVFRITGHDDFRVFRAIEVRNCSYSIQQTENEKNDRSTLGNRRVPHYHTWSLPQCTYYLCYTGCFKTLPLYISFRQHIVWIFLDTRTIAILFFLKHYVKG